MGHLLTHIELQKGDIGPGEENDDQKEHQPEIGNSPSQRFVE
jgi:hypothetical protein